MATPWKGPSRTLENIWARCNGWVKSYGAFDTLLWSGPDLISPSSDSTTTPRKMTYDNSYKNLSAVQRSDQKLWPFLAVIIVWRVLTSSSWSSGSMPTKWKRSFENSWKIGAWSNDQIKSFGPFEPLFWSSASRPPLHRVVVPSLLNGKRPSITPGKIRARSNGRIKSYGPFELLFSFGASRHPFTK
jgi:hypothetical protein